MHVSFVTVQGTKYNDNYADFCSPFFIGPSDMDEQRSSIRRRTMVQGIFRMQVDRSCSIVDQVLSAYAQNASLHNLEMKVKFTGEQGHDGGELR